MPKAMVHSLIGLILVISAKPALGNNPSGNRNCKSDHPATVYMAASCVSGVCQGHKSFHYGESNHELACSRQVKFGVAGLNAQDQKLALTILRSMNRRDGAFVAELDPKTGKRCSAIGGAFCLGDTIVKIRTAAVSPASAILVDNLASALKRKQLVDEGLLLGEFYYLLQVVFSSFAILILGSFLISHERRRLIAGVITLAYMTVFIYFYGMEAFFVRNDAFPLANTGMLAIMTFCAFSAVRGMLKDLQNGAKTALHLAIFAAEGALCFYLLYNPNLDLVTVAFGIFYIGVPTLLGLFFSGCILMFLRGKSEIEGLDESPSYSFG